MDAQNNERLLAQAKQFFVEIIAQNHLKNCTKAAHLKNYKINPFLFNYLAVFLAGEATPQNIAKSLVYPRVLGSSITTSFGTNMQKQITNLFDGFGSTVKGIDIEFIDAFDGRRKYCQLKAGPNTINKDDIKTIKDHYTDIKKRAKTNHAVLAYNDLVVGVLYGEAEELNAHYKNLQNEYEVLVGKNFWHHLTGQETFYSELIKAFIEVATETKGSSILQETINTLANEIEKKYFH